MTRLKRYLCRAMLALGALVASAGPAGAATDTAGYAHTQYPIVLVHGVFGFDRIFGVDYFYQVPADLRRNGAKVYVAQVSQLNSSAVRGEQLLQQLQQWAAADGVKKFNLIAHSQGGVDARYVAGVAPELVASVTTVASPTSLDASANNSSGIGLLLSDYGNLATMLAKAVAWLSGSHQAQDLSAAQNFANEVNDFATRFPAGVPTTYCGQGAAYANGMYLFSIAGNQVKTNAWDISDLALSAGSVPSDGVFPTCATHFGKVIRDTYPWNHFDEINHVLGLIGAGAPDPVAFYRQQANRLKLLGL